VTYYVALPFVRLENGALAPGQAVECPHSAAAIRRGVMSGSEMNTGAVAFSRSGSPELGELDDAVLLKSFGDVPEDFDCSRSWLAEGELTTVPVNPPVPPYISKIILKNWQNSTSFQSTG
jgi:hypothetical protein